MLKSTEYYVKSEKGFALVLALIAILIMMALGTLVITLSTGDIKTSAQVLGEKKAMLAAEKGLGRMTQIFNAFNPPTGVTTTLPEDLAIDPHSQYEISIPNLTASRSMPFYSLPWGMATYTIDVTGINTEYNSRVTIGVGLGYGPIDLSLIYK
jgi:Tfp pilus assembly protein PilX